jgi:hypothetical protein
LKDEREGEDEGGWVDAEDDEEAKAVDRVLKNYEKEMFWTREAPFACVMRNWPRRSWKSGRETTTR